jgi:hypothetical protein
MKALLLRRRAKVASTACDSSRFTECLCRLAKPLFGQSQGITIASLRYPRGCADARQVRKLASSPNVGNSNNAWNVNFNNGNVNNNNRNNTNYVRLVRASQWRVLL